MIKIKLKEGHSKKQLMVFRYLLITFLFVVVCFFSGIAQFRKYSNEFLNIGAGARGLAMGSAQIASVSDPTAGYWNPAALTAIKNHPSLSIMHADYFSGIAKYDFAALAIPVQNNKRTLGLSVVRFAVDDIPNTLFLVEPDGSLNFDNIQSFSSADYAFLLSYAQHFKKIKETDINIGANTKIIYRNVGSFATAWGFGIDAGVNFINKKWRLGIMAKDITTTFNAWTFSFTDREKQALYLANNDIPTQSTEMTAPRLVIGGAYKFNLSESLNLLTEANLELTFDGKRNTVISSNFLNVDPRIGIELQFKDIFFVRGGVTNFQQALADADTLNKRKVWIYQPSIGAGINIKNVTIDYSFSNLANQENPLYTHIFSLKLNIIKRKKQ